ncbi:transcriptional regulator, TetR family [Marinococcus luteus]|uniref:Transcriptional regulator, TetR family n=1 Tax=Marinococcus luteus TaxID=1122204 RepID=A0A1H2VK98_9BACI|nr:TetR/AcrR family transcriptional regulator [Marinococcus luteus]SDW68815.1 transcriptional regulator, TetR family [Marinococcus luteus]
MGKNPNRKHAQILEAGTRVIAEHGYHQAKVSDIAKEAKVADGTIYLYFNNKEHILISIFEEKMQEFMQKLEIIMQKDVSVKEQLFDMAQLQLDFMESRPELATLAHFELLQTKGEIHDNMQRILFPFFQAVIDIVNRGKEEQVFSSSLSTEIGRICFVGILNEAITTWVMEKGSYSLAAQGPVLAEIVYQALQTEV